MDNEDLNDKEGWEAIGRMLAPTTGKINKVAFKPATHIDYCLNDPFNYDIYIELTENEKFKDLFDPLVFFNLLYDQSKSA